MQLMTQKKSGRQTQQNDKIEGKEDDDDVLEIDLSTRLKSLASNNVKRMCLKFL